MSSESEIWYNKSMKLLTAKEMNLDTLEKMGNPVSNETQAVIDALASLSLEELALLYKISEERASEEEKRIQALKSGTAKTYPALKLLTVSCTGISDGQTGQGSRSGLRARAPFDYLSSFME